MTLEHFIPRLVDWLAFVTSAIVFAAAIQFYQQRARRRFFLSRFPPGLMR